MTLWPNQTFALERMAEVRPGRKVCVTSPTGGGKSKIMAEDIQRRERAILYTNRRMLLDQLGETLTEAGVRFGVRAAGHIPEFQRPVQLASIQTTLERSIKRGKWPLHEADTIYVDECHCNKEATMCEIIDRHMQQGARLFGFTATPLGIGHIYDDLVVAGTTSELREYGALVPAYCFAPDEPDTRNLKRTATGEYTQGDVVKRIMSATIIGRVLEWWRKLNPDQHPTLLFAPGVKESLWFAEQFVAAGIPAAHIDGDVVWINGTLIESDSSARAELKAKCQSGEIKIVCNRFVMREGIDWPFIRHMILATMFGALTSYLQTVGRGLRACPGKSNVCVQDHGGNYHRHGSPNSDREWFMDRTDYIEGELREHRLREKKIVEPICCPKCHAVRAGGPICRNCGFAHSQRSRIVVQKDGTLKEMKGDVYRPRSICRRPEALEIWKSMYWRSRSEKGERSFNAAAALFAYENNWQWPDPNWPFMPKNETDSFLLVKDVPMERLNADPNRKMQEVA